jgi:hypothetical protein
MAFLFAGHREHCGLAKQSVPPVRIPHRNHRRQNVIPRLRIKHRFVREHAAVPIDVLRAARWLALLITKPQASGAHDIHLAVGVVGQTVASSLVVRAGAFDRRVVLRDVEVFHPRAQHARHLAQSSIQDFLVRPVVICGQQAVFGRVVTEREQHRMRHVGLDAQRVGPSHLFEQFVQILPTVHAAPADFALGGQSLAITFRNVASFAEGVGDLPGIAHRVCSPLGGAAR